MTAQIFSLGFTHSDKIPLMGTSVQMSIELGLNGRISLSATDKAER